VDQVTIGARVGGAEIEARVMEVAFVLGMFVVKQIETGG
jgi:hypothetical protein